MSAYRPTVSVASLEAVHPSRRALIAGAVGGVAALAATAIGGATPRRVRGGIGDPLLAGSVIGASSATSGVFNNSDTNGTWVVTQNGKGTAIRGIAAKGTGGRFSTNARNKFAVAASNTSAQSGNGAAIQAFGGVNTGLEAHGENYGVDGRSVGGIGVYGESYSSTGVEAFSELADGVAGFSISGNGVKGDSNTGHGVHGISAASHGVYAASTNGAGLFATSASYYAAVFEGPTFHNTYFQLLESADPDAPDSNSARLFVRDNGGGKTQLAVRFPTGAVQVIATEP